MSFAPVYDDRSRALILGTWPSPKSREMAFYYGHPQNRFWPLLAALTGEPLPAREDIAAKKQLLLRHGLALIRWKAAPSPAHRMPPSGMWCPTISPGCCAKHPSGRCSATVPQLTVSTQNISSRLPASRLSVCPVQAPPTPPAAPPGWRRFGALRWRTGS